MEKELKPDKFLMAVLLVLEAHRQEETDTWPTEYRNRDVETLHRAIKSREGGETAILEIVVRRSDNHLRDVLKPYEMTYQSNFARDALKKSNNLVVSGHANGQMERKLTNHDLTGGGDCAHFERGDQPAGTRLDAATPCD